MKKQIVFIEYVPTIPCFKIARTLKLSKNYETVLFCFSKVDQEMFSTAYDKIIVLDIKHKINFKNVIDVLKKLFSKNGRRFVRELRGINPDLFQITGPDLFTMISMFITKNKPKVYYAYDIWQFYEKKFSLKNHGIKKFVQKNVEKICFKKADGIIHKCPENELKYLSYKVKLPEISFLPYCLEEWTEKPIRNRKKDIIDLVYAGGPISSVKYNMPFLEIAKNITSQKIHLHFYGKCDEKMDEKLYVKEARSNPYLHIHAYENVKNLNKQMRGYDFGILPTSFNLSDTNPLWPKVTMGNRLFNYIEAGIPIIVHPQLEFMNKIVKDNNIGFSIDFDKLEDIKNLRRTIKKQDYKKLQNNIIKAQDKMKMTNFINELERFYNKVILKKLQ